jgi:predicted porin
MKKITILALLIVGLCVTGANAQEAEQPLSPDGEQVELEMAEQYVFPEIKPEISLTGGYRYVHLNGSSRVEEFEYLHNSLVLGGELRTVSKDHRLHLEFEERNEKDYYGDISYAYKDLILFRGVNSTLFHNLDNISLFKFSPPSFLVNNMDPQGKYGLKVGMSNILLRFKTPDFPAHLYFEGNFVDKNGTAQQMFYHQFLDRTKNTRTSDRRDIDFFTSVYTVGANSHLGPVEADFSHSEKRFDVNGDKALVDSFDATAGTPSRTKGDYIHNIIPELKSSTNTLKLHTTYTGGLVGSATFSKTDKESRDSKATADYLFAAGDISWMPMTGLTFFVKYRHQERDVDSPDAVTVQNLTDLSKYSYAVRDSISSISDSVTGVVRYRPLKGVMLKADYTYEDIRRNDAEDWLVIPDSTQRQKLSLSGDVRIMSGLKLRAKYTHKDINNPSTNIEPEYSDEGLMTLSWMPLPGLNTFISYAIKEEKRDTVDFVNYDTGGVETADNRKVNDDRIIGTVSYVLLRNLSVTASYAYIHNKVRQEIRLSPDDPAYWDSRVPYKTMAQSYSFDVHYSPKSFISLEAGINHTISRGRFSTSASNLQDIPVFSDLKTRETNYSASGEYQFKGGFSAGLQYRYSTLKDLQDNPYNEIDDGRVSIVLLTLSKKW